MVDDAQQGPAPVGGPVAERMQALLSRAVEDQIGEQRQVAAVIGELREQVAALGAAYRATATSADLRQLGEDVAGRTGAVRTALGDRLDALARRVEEVGTRQASAQEALDALRAVPVVSPGELAAAVAGLAGRLDPLVEQLAPRVAELVLQRTGEALVPQVAQAVADRVAADLPDRLAALVEASEQRVTAHVDEAVLVLAEALLRRRRTPRTELTAALAAADDSAPAPRTPAPAAPAPAPAAPPAPAPPAVVDLQDAAPQHAGTGDAASLAAAPADDVFPEVLGYDDGLDDGLDDGPGAPSTPGARPAGDADLARAEGEAQGAGVALDLRDAPEGGDGGSGDGGLGDGEDPADEAGRSRSWWRPGG